MVKTKTKTPKRHLNTKISTDIMLQIKKPAIRRIASRAGVKRLKSDVYDDARIMLRGFLTKVIRDSREYTQNRGRKTTNVQDIMHALENNKFQVYCFLS